MTDERILWITDVPESRDYFLLQGILKRKGYGIEFRNPETALEEIAPECEGIELIVISSLVNENKENREEFIKKIKEVYTGLILLYLEFRSDKARDEVLKRTGADYAFNGRFVPVDFTQVLEAIFNKTEMPRNLVPKLT